jgi:tRNA pseudouridine38-40 synthase
LLEYLNGKMNQSNFYHLKIRYNGFQYIGWQVQREQGLTVQGQLEQAIKIVSKSNDIQVIGSSRTDSGVHAVDQNVKIKIPIFIEPDHLLLALNVNLPPDIRVVFAGKTESSFQPSFHSKSKIYSYYFIISRYKDVFQAQTISSIKFDLDIEKMKNILPLFVGKHDFKNYMTLGTFTNTTVREILNIELITHPISADLIFLPNVSEIFEVRIHGKGFLKQMVRIIVGVLWQYGRGKISEDDIKNSLNGIPFKKRPAVAPPQGLYLRQTFF